MRLFALLAAPMAGVFATLLVLLLRLPTAVGYAVIFSIGAVLVGGTALRGLRDPALDPVDDSVSRGSSGVGAHQSLDPRSRGRWRARLPALLTSVSEKHRAGWAIAAILVAQIGLGIGGLGLNLILAPVHHDLDVSIPGLLAIIGIHSTAMLLFPFTNLRLGRRYSLRSCFVVFSILALVSACTAALASSPVVLAVGESGLGLSQALMTSASLGIIVLTLEDRDRVAAFGGLFIAGLVGAILASLIAGPLRELLGWRSVYWSVAILVAASAPTAWFGIGKFREPRAPAIDWIAAAAMILSVSSFVVLGYAVETGRISLLEAGIFAVYPVISVALTMVRARGERRLLRRPSVAATSFVRAVQHATPIACLLFLGLYLAFVAKTSATLTGLMFLAFLPGFIAGPAVRRVVEDHFGPRGAIVAALVMVASGAIIFGFSVSDTDLNVISIGTVLLGAGLGQIQISMLDLAAKATEGTVSTHDLVARTGDTVGVVTFVVLTGIAFGDTGRAIYRSLQLGFFLLAGLALLAVVIAVFLTGGRSRDRDLDIETEVWTSLR